MMRVVVVEDDALVAKYLKYVIEQHCRYEVVVTESGDDVLLLARDPVTAVLIVDVSLRGTQLNGRYVDGLELTRAIKADPQALSIPVVLATAHAMVGDHDRFIRASGADAFVRKPFADIHGFLSTIAELAARRTP